MNPRIAEIPPSIIRTIHAARQPGDIDLGLGEPTLPPELEPFEAALAWTRRNGSPYSPNAGFPELRELVASYLAREPWCDGAPTAANVCVTVGSEEALFLAIKTVVDPARDEVLIVEPCYLAYPKICLLEGIRFRMVGLSAEADFEPDADRVLEALRPDTRLVVINTPANPTGRVWPAAELERLADGLAGRERRIFVLADEVYRELYFGDAAPASSAAYHGDTLIAGSLSKSNALTGLRLGWLAGPADVLNAAVKVHQFVNTAASTFSQRVAVELLREPSSLAAHRPAYASTRDLLISEAGRCGVRLLEPEGTFYALVALPPHLAADSGAAARDLLERERVVTVPGIGFGASSEGWLRISWVAPPEVVREGITRIGRWINSD